MTFLQPLGLLGLIGIPVLILIYLIKNRYTEQTIASTYLWRLSERFLKRKNPISKITGIISLILQLLLVTVLSLAVAHPTVTLPGAAREYCIVLDASASMNMSSDGSTRFDLAKEEAEEIVKGAKNGSTFTVVVIKDTAEVLIEQSDDADRVVDLIDSATSCDGPADYTEALGIIQGYFDKNPSLLIHFITDTEYSELENVNLINVARSESNVSLEDLAYVKSGKSTVVVTGNVIAYGADAVVDVVLYSSGSAEPIGQTKVQTFKDKAAVFNLTVELEDFYSLMAVIPNEDAYAKDNVAVVYDVESENSYNALLVSDAPFLIEKAIDAVSSAVIKVMSTEDYEKEEQRLAKLDRVVNGYSLYVFDSFSPATMPTDGSVWFIGTDTNVAGSGFSVQGEVVLDNADVITCSTSTSSIVRNLTAGLLDDDIYISRYVKCGIYGDFTTLFSYRGNPVVFTGMNDYGNREVVFAFSLHDSDITLSLDYLILLSNLLNYSFPEVVEKTEYYCGDTAEINVISGCESIRVETPNGQVVYTDVSAAVSEFELTEVGQYKITVNVSGAERPAYYVYSSVPKEERKTETAAEYLGIQGEAEDKGSDGRYDPLVLLFVFAALLFTAEWMVYCYDKYQLR